MDSTRPGAGDRTSPNNSARLRLVHPEVIAEGRQLNGKCLGANAFLASIVFFSTIPHVLWLAFHVSRFFGGFYISCHTYCMFLAVFAFCSSTRLKSARKLLEQANELRDLFACMDMEPGSTQGSQGPQGPPGPRDERWGTNHKKIKDWWPSLTMNNVGQIEVFGD